MTKLNNDGNHEWTKLIGTNNYERSSDFVIDKDGSIYILGDTSTKDLGLQNPNYFDKNTDILVTKLNQNGEIKWTKIFEEEHKDRGGSIDIDNEGNIIFSKLGSGYDGYDYYYSVYLTKLDQNGEILIHKDVRHGYPLDSGTDLKVDDTGSIFLTGTFSRESFPNKEKNSYLSNFDSNFNLIWETNFESPQDDHPEKILLGDNNNIYVIGKTYGDLNGETKFNFQTVNNRSDAFITKFDENGANTWTKLYGRRGSDEGFTARSNSDGSIDLIGITGYNASKTSFFILKSVEEKVTLGVVNENYIQNNNGFSSINGSKPVDISLDIGSLNSLYVKDYGGNVHAGDESELTPSSYKYQGMLDVNGDGTFETIFTNKISKRWVTGEVDSITGQIDFSDHGAGGTTRVVGIYIDPLVTSGEVEQFGPHDSQRRFQNDLEIDNLVTKHSGDYDSDGVHEVYWKTSDGSAYLRSLMHADGNIRYANYQSEAQMKQYLTSNGHESIIFEII